MIAAHAASAVLVAVAFLGAPTVAAENPPEILETACKEIAAAAGKFPNLVTRRSKGQVRDDKTRSSHEGCSLVAQVKGISFSADGWPHDVLRKGMTSEGWREDPSRAADGAGSTAFALHRDKLLCLFAAIWETAEPAEPEDTAAAWYKLEVGCFEARR